MPTEPATPASGRQDRRRLIRVDVRGEVSGRVDGQQLPLMLRNLSSGGFLAEASASLPIGSVHTIKLSGHNERMAIVTARCAHCRPLVPSVVPRFAIGFEFVAARPDEIEALLDQLMPDIAFP